MCHMLGKLYTKTNLNDYSSLTAGLGKLHAVHDPHEPLGQRHGAKEVNNSLYFLSHEKLHTAVLAGVVNISDTP